MSDTPARAAGVGQAFEDVSPDAASSSSARRGRSIAVFCRVVDNVGDAGVCWRLARQLAVERGHAVTLFIDRLDVLRPLWTTSAAASTADGALRVDGVDVRPWPDDDAPALPDDTLWLCTFACEPPPLVRARIGALQRARAPGSVADDRCWINVEHLTAECWVDEAHRRPSIKPSDGAREHYFFPGFSPSTGGLLRERDLAGRLGALTDPARREAWLQALGVPPAEPGASTLTISLFCYPEPAVDALLALLDAQPRPVRLLVPAGVATAAIASRAAAEAASARARAVSAPADANPSPPPAGREARGALRIVPLPWLDQRRFDELLACCDLNFVRGEDSWIRAHWAGRPFVWQPYPQAPETRRVKLDAWLDRLTAGWPAAGAAATRAMHHAWIGDGDLAQAWPGFIAWAHSALGATRWQVFQLTLQRQADLVSQLLEFTAEAGSG